MLEKGQPYCEHKATSNAKDGSVGRQKDRSECRGQVIHLCIPEQTVQWLPREGTCVCEYVNEWKDGGPQNLQDIFLFELS